MIIFANINNKVMARPIKETPIVSGKDAVKFAEKMANAKPASKDEIEYARGLYEAVKAKSNFEF
jgi:hypothetical protein